MRSLKEQAIESRSREDLYAQWDAVADPQPTPLVETEPDFECRICLEAPTDPCVTRCGHLYCLNCLRQWLDFSPKCPACKTPCNAQQVVPIFGTRSSRGASPTVPYFPFNSATKRITNAPPSDPSTYSPSSSKYSDLSSNPTSLLFSPPIIRFTDDEPCEDPPPKGVEDDEWDTDAELDLQLNQIATVRMPKQISGAVSQSATYTSQHVSRALSVAALALMLTVLLK